MNRLIRCMLSIVCPLNSVMNVYSGSHDLCLPRSCSKTWRIVNVRLTFVGVVAIQILHSVPQFGDFRSNPSEITFWQYFERIQYSGNN